MSGIETPIPSTPGLTSDGSLPCGNIATCPLEESVASGPSAGVSPQSPQCPTDFNIDASCRIVKADGGQIQITASDLDGFSGGTFTWTTNSDKINLINPNSGTVTVEALSDVSSGRDAEILRVTRTENGCGAIEKTVALTVAKVVFSKSTLQRYGFDDYGTPDNSLDNHICVKKGDYTYVKVTIEGGAVGTDFQFICDNTAVCTTQPPPGSQEFDLRLNAGNRNKSEEWLRANAICDNSMEFSRIVVHVYKERVVNVVVAKIDHPSTTYLRFSTADYAAHTPTANNKLKEAVVKYNITNFDRGNAITPVTFASSNGTLTYDIASGGGADLSAIRSAMTGTGSKVRVAIIREMKSYYYLSAAAAVGDTTITVSGTVFFKAGDTAPLGTGTGSETITITAVSGSTITCNALTKAHAAGTSLEFPAGGWSSDPILIQEGHASLQVAKWTILHEVGHRLEGLNLRDIDDNTSFMHFQQSWTDYRLRYCPRNLKYSSGTENQWDTIPRT